MNLAVFLTMVHSHSEAIATMEISVKLKDKEDLMQCCASYIIQQSITIILKEK